MNASSREQMETVAPFKAELAAILDRQLTAENIDIYAEAALDDLANLTERVVVDYCDADNQTHTNELEDAAFRYFNLEEMEGVLDHIAKKAAEIQDLESVIAAAHATDTIIIPPDAGPTIEPGKGGGVEDRQTVPRLKALLFILANDFGIDVHDRDKLSITSGSVDDNMVRREGYYLVEIPGLQRTVLICNELSNATYVLNSSYLEDRQIETEVLMSLTKKELLERLEADPDLGQRLVQRQHFVPSLIAALGEASDDQPSIPSESTGRYLAPKAPEGTLSFHGLFHALEAGRAAVEEAIQALGDELGDAPMYRFGAHILQGYDQTQQERVRQYLEDSGHYRRPPDGYMHSYELAKAWEIGVTSIRNAALNLGEDLGTLQVFTSPNGGRRVEYYSPEQQQLIRTSLEVAGTIEDKAPEGVLSVLGIAKQYKVNHPTVVKALEEIGGDLGETRTYKFGSRTTTGYSPAQQELVRQQLEARGLLVSEAPEGVVSLLGMSKLPSFPIGDSALRRIVKELRGELGEIRKYRFGSRGRVAEGYTPEQQTFIKARIEKKGLVEPPDDHLDVPALEERAGISSTVLYRAIERLDSDLGPIICYKGARGSTPHYSPHQQEVIVQDIIRRSVASIRQ